MSCNTVPSSNGPTAPVAVRSCQTSGVNGVNVEPVTISYESDFWTQYRATRAVVSRTLGTVLGYTFFVGVPLLTLIAMGLTDYDLTSPAAFGLPAWTILPAGLFFMVVFLPLVHALNVWSYRRRNRSVAGKHIVTLADEGIAVKGESFETRLKWDAILKASETKEFFLLYIAPRWAHFIPKVAVGPAVNLNAVRSLLQDKLGARSRLRRNV